MVHEHYGCRDAYISQLIRRKAKCICRRLGFTRSDIADVEHDLWVHLLERQQHFNSSRASFETFADRVIENKCRSILRHRRAQKRDCRRELFSLNEVVEGADGELTSRHETVASRSHRPDCNDLAEDVRMMLVQLNETERAIVLDWLKGMSKGQIRKHLGLKRRELDGAWDRICEVAEGLDLHEYFGQ